MIAPDRELAAQFARSLAETRAFQVLAEIRSYPSHQVLEMRLRQLQPDVVLLDLATDLEQACDLIRVVTSLGTAVHVVGLHIRNDSEAILRSLRLGASEFLYQPFDPEIGQQAVSRLRRLLAPQRPVEREHGKVIIFSSSKPGSGASMLASQVGFALRKATGQRVLLADLDLMGGTTSFYLKPAARAAVSEVMEDEPANWTWLGNDSDGLDLLSAPEMPVCDALEPARLHEFLEMARQHYGWVILDLPAVFHRLSLLALSEADAAFLVSTPELPSLHLTRKAVDLLGQLGFGRDRFQVLVNRVSRRDGLGVSDVQKMVNCPVHASFPNDYFSLDRAVAVGEPLGAESELGRSIEEFAGRLAGLADQKHKPAAAALAARPAFSET
jgi:pilus assembly protein CpaE